MNELAAKVVLELGEELERIEGLESLPAAVYSVLSPYMPMDWLNLGLVVRKSDGALFHRAYGYRSESFEKQWWTFHSEHLISIDFLLEKALKARKGEVLGMECYNPDNEVHRYVKEVVARKAYTQHGLAGIILNDGHTHAALVLFRDDVALPFVEKERALFKAMLPLLCMAVKTHLLVQRSTMMMSGVEALLAQRSRNMLILDQNQVLLFMSDGMRQLVTEHFPQEPPQGIPRGILSWVRELASSPPVEQLLGGPFSLTLDTSRGRLNCEAYAVKGEGGFGHTVVLVSRDTPELDFSALKEAGLTSKEIETLSYLPPRLYQSSNRRRDEREGRDDQKADAAHRRQTRCQGPHGNPVPGSAGEPGTCGKITSIPA